MARNYRDPFVEGAFYHIYNKVVTGERLFKTTADYERFLIRFRRYFQNYFSIYAYCLIPNHHHFLVKVKEDIPDTIFANENTNAARKYLLKEVPLNDVIENQLSRMFSGVTLRYNRINKRVGPLFKQGTKRVKLRTEGRVLQCLKYVHHNPIHHGLTGDYNEWGHSSYNQYLLDDETLIKVDHVEILDLIGGREVFIEMHKLYREEMMRRDP